MAHLGGACHYGCRGAQAGDGRAPLATRAYETWTDAEEAQLRRLFLRGWSVARLAESLGRQPGGIRARLRRLELID
jgi:hypothetical protein